MLTNNELRKYYDYFKSKVSGINGDQMIILWRISREAASMFAELKPDDQVLLYTTTGGRYRGVYGYVAYGVVLRKLEVDEKYFPYWPSDRKASKSEEKWVYRFLISVKGIDPAVWNNLNRLKTGLLS